MLLVEARRAPPPDPDATPTPQPILRWKMDDLRSVHVTDGSRTTRLDRVGDEWRVIEPADAGGQSASGGRSLADPHTIYWPLLELAGLEARLLVSQEVQDKAAYGLEVPTLTITVETDSGDRERLHCRARDGGRDGLLRAARRRSPAVHRRPLQNRVAPTVAVRPALPGHANARRGTVERVSIPAARRPVERHTRGARSRFPYPPP